MSKSMPVFAKLVHAGSEDDELGVICKGHARAVEALLPIQVEVKLAGSSMTKPW